MLPKIYILDNSVRNNEAHSLLRYLGQVSRETKQGYLWILDCFWNSDIPKVEVESPNLRDSTDIIVNKGSERMGRAIDAADAEESKLGIGW